MKLIALNIAHHAQVYRKHIASPTITSIALDLARNISINYFSRNDPPKTAEGPAEIADGLALLV
jgi:hypothetical protein